MPAIILQNPNAVQFNYILEYAQKENVKFEVSENPVFGEMLTDEEIKLVEKSLNSGICKDVSALKEYLSAQL
jgi:hypothetical protein